MDEYPSSARFTSADLVACVEETMQVATFRYFSREGPFAAALSRLTGMPLPAVLRVTHSVSVGLRQARISWASSRASSTAGSGMPVSRLSAAANGPSREK